MPFVPYMVYDMGLVDDYREPGLYAGAVDQVGRGGIQMPLSLVSIFCTSK
jgi:hypothetical protein